MPEPLVHDRRRDDRRPTATPTTPARTIAATSATARTARVRGTGQADGTILATRIDQIGDGALALPGQEERRETHRPADVGCCSSLVLVPAPAAAQSVSDVLSFLLTNRAVQTDDFERDAAAAAATRDTVTTLLGAELATLPPSLSSAGFTYRFNSTLGTAERASTSFGSFFTERSLTARQGPGGARRQRAHGQLRPPRRTRPARRRAS